MCQSETSFFQKKFQIVFRFTSLLHCLLTFNRFLPTPLYLNINHVIFVDLPSQQEDKAPRRGIYIGESSHSLYERSKEHLKDSEDFSPSSHMVKHWMQCHEEMKTFPDFSFTITGRLKDSLSRQVAKAIQSILPLIYKQGHNTLGS